MKKIIVLFLFAGAIIAQAQVPGYLGKKNSFGYESHFSVAYSEPNSRFNVTTFGVLGQYFEPGYYSPTKKFMALSLTHTFIYDRIIKRNASFNACFSIFKSGINLLPITEYDNTTMATSTLIGGNAKISGFAINVAYRRYRNYLAPLGQYAGYFLGFASASAQVHSSKSDSTKFDKAHATTPKFGYVYGRQNVFFDKLIIDRGFSVDFLGFLLGFVSKRKASDNFSTSIANRPLDYFGRQLKTRMYYRDLVTFYIGAKYMF